ncbi:hypothetical protein HN865_00060 [Candidatus Woesearchaeota archaeon]|jgi:hypothetical protein|nr:hypothetical protein [Candidatus Woesearchaeota archaeon]MBT7237236.1 hypothetical protein [Candidatus Woesearchaeota archaeon]
MKNEKYGGKRFIVTIRRDTAERRYVLSVCESDGSFKEQNEPLYFKEFEEHYGFSPNWPHETIEDKLN